MAISAPNRQGSAGRPKSSRRTAGHPSKPVRYIHHPSYDDPQAVRRILESLPSTPADSSAAGDEAAGGRGDAEASSGAMSVEQERWMFRRLNCLKHLAVRRLEGGEADPAHGRAANHLLESARQIRDEILLANQGLIISIAQKFAKTPVPVEDLIAEANILTCAVIDAFDCDRGFRFSTYATHSIRRHLVRVYAAVAAPSGWRSARVRACCVTNPPNGASGAGSHGESPAGVSVTGASRSGRTYTGGAEVRLGDRGEAALSGRVGPATRSFR